MTKTGGMQVLISHLFKSKVNHEISGTGNVLNIEIEAGFEFLVVLLAHAMPMSWSDSDRTSGES